MNTNSNKNSTELLEKTKEALIKNNMEAYVVENKAQAKELVEKLLEKGSTISSGGSVTLGECGIMELLRSDSYDYIDREKFEDKREAYIKSFAADYYLCSSNAVTQSGELYNVDGNGNRVAAICYGPSKVILLVGKNKIVENISEAEKRVKEIAAPLNSRRLGYETYCLNAGVCMGEAGDFAKGCHAPARICCQYVVTGFQRIKGRITVILINEDCGY